jgi:hypothetical protein
MHDREARATGPVQSAAVIVTEIMILLNIDLSIAQIAPASSERAMAYCVTRLFY